MLQVYIIFTLKFFQYCITTWNIQPYFTIFNVTTSLKQFSTHCWRYQNNTLQNEQTSNISDFTNNCMKKQQKNNFFLDFFSQPALYYYNEIYSLSGEIFWTTNNRSGSICPISRRSLIYSSLGEERGYPSWTAAANRE